MKNTGNIINIQTINKNAKKTDLVVCTKDLGSAKDGFSNKVSFKVMHVISFIVLLMLLTVSSSQKLAVIFFRKHFRHASTT